MSATGAQITSNDEDLARAREATVLAHIAAEEQRDFEAALATFARPRYELPGGEVVDGREDVAEMYRDLFGGFPDAELVDTDPPTLADLGSSVVGIFRLTGTHLGSFRGLPPTGRRIDLPAVVAFDFDGTDLVNERVIFDRLTLFIQLGVARDPDSTAGKLRTLLNHPFHLLGATLRGQRTARGARR